MTDKSYASCMSTLIFNVCFHCTFSHFVFIAKPNYPPLPSEKVIGYWTLLWAEKAVYSLSAPSQAFALNSSKRTQDCSTMKMAGASGLCLRSLHINFSVVYASNDLIYIPLLTLFKNK